MPSKKGDSDQRLEENWSIMNTDDCQDDTETPEIIVDDVESVLSESRWEWAEDNGSVGLWQDETHEQCSVSHGTLAWRSHKALSLQSSQRILSSESGNYNMEPDPFLHESHRNIYRVKEIYLDRMHFCGTEWLTQEPKQTFNES